MDTKQAKKDLETKVRELLKEISKLGVAKLIILETKGSGIVDDHLANGCDFTTPREFILALAEEIEWQYELPGMGRADRRRIKNYHLMM